MIVVTVDEWIEEFNILSPVDTDGMDLFEAAEIVVECGVSPLAVLQHIAFMTRKDIEERTKR